MFKKGLLALRIRCYPDAMKMRKKSDLPTKICATCGRPFTWRKKWAKVWDEVRYCSDACRRQPGTQARVTISGT